MPKSGREMNAHCSEMVKSRMAPLLTHLTRLSPHWMSSPWWNMQTIWNFLSAGRASQLCKSRSYHSLKLANRTNHEETKGEKREMGKERGENSLRLACS